MKKKNARVFEAVKWFLCEYGAVIVTSVITSACAVLTIKYLLPIMK